MASTYKTLVVQQLYDSRPSPTLEVNRSLDASSSYSPGHTPCPSAGLSSSTSHKQDYFAQSRSTEHQHQHEHIHTRPNSQVFETAAPPSTPAATPSRRAMVTTDTNKAAATTSTSTSTPKSTHQRVASENGLPAIKVTRTPVSMTVANPPTSSPKGVTDVFSLSSDKQLSAQYWFMEEIGYGNWVSPGSSLASLAVSFIDCIILSLPLSRNSPHLPTHRIQGSVWKIKRRNEPQEELAAKLIYRIKDDKTTPARVKSIWQEFKSVSSIVCNSDGSCADLHVFRRIIRNFKKDPHPNIIHFYDL